MRNEPVKWIFIVFLTAALSGCGGDKLQSYWKTSEIVIDAKENDWDSDRFISSQDGKISLNICNDEEYLYAMVKLADRQIEQRIHRFGITFRLNEKGNKSAYYGIMFRSESADKTMDMMRGTGDRMMDIRRNMMPDTIINGYLSGHVLIDGIPFEYISPNNIVGPSAAFGNEKGIKLFEFRLPLRIEKEDGEQVNLCESAKAGLGIEIGKMDINTMGDRSKPFGGLGGMPGGGMGGRGSGRKGGRKSMEFRSPQQKDIELWLKLELVKNEH